MVPVEVMCSLSKVAIQGYQPFCLGVMMVSIETCPKAVGSEAYVTFAAVNEGCIFACKCFMERMWCLGKKDMSSFGLRTNLTAFLSAHRIILDSLLVMGCRGSREGCLHQGSRKGGVLAEAELGRGTWERSSNISFQCLFNNAWREV